MKIVVDHPPNFAEIASVFPEARNCGILFAYGDTIYNPSDVQIPPELIAHEGVHGNQHRQAGGPERWWRSYIDDVSFRAAQELAAHQVEFRVLCQRVRDRNVRARALHMIAVRLSGPLYGNAISFDEAQRRIREAA